MSDQFPPEGQPPQGQPPQGRPYGSGQPEYLSSGSGQPVGPSPVAPAGGGRRRAVIGGAVIGGLAIVGGGAYGLSSFLSSGASASEALPASTVGFVSVNLDPGGAQKIEAIRTLRKFPAFRDEVGLDTDDDLRKRFFEEAQSGGCETVDYDEDVKPWLGDRMAMAAVDTGDEQPHPVAVVEVTDAGAAEDGFATLIECGEEAAAQQDAEGLETDAPEAPGGYVIEGDWAVIAETEEIARTVVDAAAEEPLSDDESYNRWMDEAGDEGIISMYAAPAAGDYFATQLGSIEDQLEAPLGGITGTQPDVAAPSREELLELGYSEQEIDELGLADEPAADGTGPSTDGSALPPEVEDALKDFEGAAGTVRFDDGALELEFAMDAGKQAATLSGSDRGGDVVETLPEDTLMALGVGFADDWFSQVMEQLSSMAGEDVDLEDMIAEAEEQTGLTLPEDVEILVGESVAVSVGGDIDLEAIFNGGGPADVPVGVKVKGDPEEIEEVLAKLTAQMGDDAALLETETDGDFVAFGADTDYRSALAEDGGLGDTDAYQEVIEESDRAGALMFLNFDTSGDWLKSLSADDPTIAENVEPLSAFGVSGWVEDGASHGLVKLTTD
ncbi:DUF3352 domain-containing protein [uncultured Nocardioides sp.]|uniref:DUF3352 domain-containing protein n=1 Tax=uncultured Nocardioides sp. TaxID=198441 RepID=UPI0025E33C40|nr:DUF3352 domain-containing protein [uncultured Nocardioides sp.]